MGKYAANPNCPACKALGELCLNCAGNWKLAQVDRELRLLRLLEREVRKRFPQSIDTLEKLDRLRARRPKLKAPPPIGGEGATKR